MALCEMCLGEAVVTLVDVDATEIGLPSGMLRGVERMACVECGEIALAIPTHGAVVKKYRQSLASVDRDLTADEFTYLRRSLGMSGKQYAETLGVTNVTVSRVENGSGIPAMQDTMIRALTLLDTMSLEAVRQLTTRSGHMAEVDVQEVERGLARMVTPGWMPISTSKAVSSNVVPFRAAGRRPVFTSHFNGRVSGLPVVVEDWTAMRA